MVSTEYCPRERAGFIPTGTGNGFFFRLLCLMEIFQRFDVFVCCCVLRNILRR